MGSCAAPSAKGDDKFITTDYLQQCPIFYHMTKYIRHSGSWNEMEFMRDELRRVLNEIDIIRHDAGNVRLRKTKPVRDA